MGFQTDAGGLAFACGDIKLFTALVTWATRLSQLPRQAGTVRIITYSLPRLEYVKTQLARRPHDLYLVVHDKFAALAAAIKAQFPRVRVAVHPRVHSKVLLIAPQTLWISGANFGDNDWHETTIGLHSQPAHDWYVSHMFDPLWQSARELGA
jgi:phosphatidylserine/phosphatidylglycerophosphate/cardiolipin synthase-like enzyme